LRISGSEYYQVHQKCSQNFTALKELAFCYAILKLQFVFVPSLDMFVRTWYD